MGELVSQTWVPFAASGFGAICDLPIVFSLLGRRRRATAYVLVILFHVATWLLFNIGMFPWIMVISATLCFSPEWPRRWLQRLFNSFFDHQSPKEAQPETRQGVGVFAPTSPLLHCALIAYCIVQLALPLRSYFAGQPVAWTCSGFNCAWRVMLVEKTGYAEFFAFDPTTSKRWKLAVKDYLTPRQEALMAQDPYLIRIMATRLAADLRKRGFPQIQVKVNSFATLNGRPSQRMIDPEVDLAGTLSSEWIPPLTNRYVVARSRIGL
jgi:hypothetical protein